jgi:hypothetical protein
MMMQQMPGHAQQVQPQQAQQAQQPPSPQQVLSPQAKQQGAAWRDTVAARQRPRGRQAPAEGFRAPTGE